MRLEPNKDDVGSSATTLVFLAAFNGGAHIKQQLLTIFAQTRPVYIVVSDDGSTDDTCSIVQSFIDAKQPIELIAGPQRGFAQNFLSALDRPDLDKYQYLAFSDQDDEWLPNHLENAQEAIGENSLPCLVGSRTEWIDQSGRSIGYSVRRGVHLSFENALVQSLAGGNTMVLNRAAIQWLRICLRSVTYPLRLSHDWLLYQLITGAGFEVRFSQTPTVKYRQHHNNLMGENRSLKARLARFKAVLSDEYKQSVDAHLSVLSQVKCSLTEKNQHVLDILVTVRNQTLVARARAWNECGLRREPWYENIIFYLLFLLGYY